MPGTWERTEGAYKSGELGETMSYNTDEHTKYKSMTHVEESVFVLNNTIA